MRHLPNPWYELGRSLVDARSLPPWSRHRWKYLTAFGRWQLDARFAPPLEAEGLPQLTVILLSYARVRNMEPIVRSLLKARFVGRIVLSNNNPAIRIRDWVRLRDERLVLVDQPSRTPPGVRFTLAMAQPGDLFVSIDDDVLLHPRQLRDLFRALLERPDEPHGVQGEYYVRRDQWAKHPGVEAQAGWLSGMKGYEGRVHTLNRVYAFTRTQLEVMTALTTRLGLDVGSMANGEDVLLSVTGRTVRPYLHDFGPLAECLSSHRVGVATWLTRQDFWAERAELYLRVRALREAGVGGPCEPPRSG